MVKTTADDILGKKKHLHLIFFLIKGFNMLKQEFEA